MLRYFSNSGKRLDVFEMDSNHYKTPYMVVFPKIISHIWRLWNQANNSPTVALRFEREGKWSFLGGLAFLWHRKNAQRSNTIDLDGGIPFQRTVVLANPAADAQFAQNVGALQRDRLTGLVDHVHFLQSNGFLGGGTHLFADDAGDATGPGQAAVTVYDSGTDDRLAFLFQSQSRNGAGWADLTAGIATIITVPKARYQGGESSRLPGQLPPGWLVTRW